MGHGFKNLCLKNLCLKNFCLKNLCLKETQDNVKAMKVGLERSLEADRWCKILEQCFEYELLCAVSIASPLL